MRQNTKNPFSAAWLSAKSSQHFSQRNFLFLKTQPVLQCWKISVKQRAKELLQYFFLDIDSCWKWEGATEERTWAEEGFYSNENACIAVKRAGQSLACVIPESTLCSTLFNIAPYQLSSWHPKDKKPPETLWPVWAIVLLAGSNLKLPVDNLEKKINDFAMENTIRETAPPGPKIQEMSVCVQQCL